MYFCYIPVNTILNWITLKQEHMNFKLYPVCQSHNNRRTTHWEHWDISWWPEGCFGRVDRPLAWGPKLSLDICIYIQYTHPHTHIYIHWLMGSLWKINTTIMHRNAALYRHACLCVCVCVFGVLQSGTVNGAGVSSCGLVMTHYLFKTKLITRND